MDKLSRCLRCLPVFPLAAFACTTPTDNVLVPDQVSSVQGMVGSGAAPARMSSVPVSSMLGGAPEQPKPSSAVESAPTAPAAMSGTVAGGEAQAPATAPTAGSAGSSDQVAAAGGTGGNGQTAGRSSDMVPLQPTGAADADCDFNGVWMAKQLTVSEALGLPQTSNSWLYLVVQQIGQELLITSSLECGIEVQGTATVTLSRATLEAALRSNSQVGRKATLKKLEGKCAFESARFWKIRGADEQHFLPNGARDAMQDIAKVAMDNPLPTNSKTDGAIDTEGDGKLGMAFQVTGVITGVRNSVQREWSTWFTAPGFEIDPSMDWPDELTMRADFDNEESILDPTSGLLAATGLPSRSAQHQLKLRFLGRDPSDARAAAIMKDNDLETCYAIQDAMKAELLQ